ncbi:MAG: tRNA dihydrouridine synthase DusB [Clostridia bacterium]|nr:tRNA dihydrouridine synthase DusB [Clostridia bacterium]
MRIGNLEFSGFAGLAPMAGVADRAMREICALHGAAFTIGELASAKGISLGDKKSAELLFCEKKGVPTACQLFGCEPDIMAFAAQKALSFEPDFIDINMGCPAPKVSGHGGGSALMKNPELAGKIVEAVVGAVDVPVTVKMRSGWDKDSLNAPELALICEQAGASAITVHGRTKSQMYAPPVDLQIIKKVKETVKIPVIANGDITDGKSAKEMLEITGCDFLMVGRAARGNPFVFEEINAYLEGREYTEKNLEERLNVFIEQIELMLRYRNHHKGILETRKHAAWYMNGIKGAASLRRMCGEISSFDDVLRLCETALELNKQI